MPTAAEFEYLVRVSEPDSPSTWRYLGSTHGRSTTSGDTPASVHVPPSLGTLPTFGLSIFDGVEPVLNPRASFGAMTLSDVRGDLDYLTGVVLDGGILQIRRGLPGALYSGFSTVAEMTTAGLLYNLNRKTIRLQNLGRILETANLHDSVYGGTGGADGDAQLAGVVKPYGIGSIFNATPKLINASLLIFQLSDGAIYNISPVREGGNSVSFSGNDRANYAALAAATIAAGEYDTCLAEGLFRLGSSPSLPITVDFVGDTNGGTPYLKRGDIAKRIVTRSGTALSTGQVNSSALTALNAAKTADCGYFWDSTLTKAAALNEVMAGCLGYWFVDLTGSLQLGYLSAPGSSPVASYEFGNQTGNPTCDEVWQAPRWKTTLGYQRNYTRLDRSQAPSATDTDAQVFAEDAQWKSEETSGNKTKYPTAAEVRAYSGLLLGTAAQTEATAQQTLFSTIRERWQIPIYDDPFTLAALVGQRIAITNCPRYSWGSSRTFILVGVSWGSNLIPTATLWG